MLTETDVRSVVIDEIRALLLEDDQEVDALTGQEQLVDLGLNSLLLARLIIALESAFETDPFNDGRVSLADIRSVNDLVAAYQGAGGGGSGDSAQPHAGAEKVATEGESGAQATAAARLSYSSIDDYLGPAQGRFFSSGYRRADYQVGDIVVSPADDGRPDVTASVSVAYPRDWSTKEAGIHLRPHLSSIDMLVLAVSLSEMYLRHTYALDRGARRKAWLRRVTLKAGTTPQEDLDGMAASAVLRETKPAEVAEQGFVSTFDCRVGVMQALCEIQHDIADRVEAAGSYGSVDDLLGPAGARYYGDGFKSRQQLIEDVLVDMATLRADASVRVAPTRDGGIVNEGVDGDHQPLVSMIDCFVVNLQLAQVLMYEMDSIARSESNTLWMIRTVLEAERPDRPCQDSLPASMSVAGKHLLELRGGTWRNTDFVGALGGVNLRCSFAHELPADAAARAS